MSLMNLLDDRAWEWIDFASNLDAWQGAPLLALFDEKSFLGKTDTNVFHHISVGQGNEGGHSIKTKLWNQQ